MATESSLPHEYIITNLDTLKIIADPTRLEVMRAFKKPRTVKEVAEILHKDPTKLYYHVRQLEKHELIHVVDTNIVSGIIEKTYQVVARQFRVEERLISAAEMTDENLDAIFHAVFDVARDEIRRSIRADLMKPGDKTPPRKHGVTKTAMYLTEEQAIELFSKLESLTKEYEALSDANEEKAEATLHSLLLAFYPLYQSDVDDHET